MVLWSRLRLTSPPFFLASSSIFFHKVSPFFLNPAVNAKETHKQLWDFLLDLPVALKLLMYSQYKHTVTDAAIWLVYFNLNIDEIVEKMFFFPLKNILMIAVLKHLAACCKTFIQVTHISLSTHRQSLSVAVVWSNVWRSDAAADTTIIWLCFSAKPAAGARHESAGIDSLLASCTGRWCALRCRDKPAPRTQIQAGLHAVKETNTSKVCKLFRENP